MNKISSNGLLIATSTFQYPHGWMDGWLVGVWTRNIFLKICVLGLTMVVSYVLTTNHQV